VVGGENHGVVGHRGAVVFLHAFDVVVLKNVHWNMKDWSSQVSWKSIWYNRRQRLLILFPTCWDLV